LKCGGDYLDYFEKYKVEPYYQQDIEYYTDMKNHVKKF